MQPSSLQRGPDQPLQLRNVNLEVPIHETRWPRCLDPATAIAESKVGGFAFALLAIAWISRPLAACQVEAVVDVRQVANTCRLRKFADALAQPSIPQLDPSASLRRCDQVCNVGTRGADEDRMAGIQSQLIRWTPFVHVFQVRNSHRAAELLGSGKHSGKVLDYPIVGSLHDQHRMLSGLLTRTR